MIYVFLGKEFNLINNKINFVIENSKITNIINYDFEEIELIDIFNESNYVDLFNEKKLIYVTNFSFKKLTTKEEKLFEKYLENMNENVIILRCIDDSLDKRKKYINMLYSLCKVETISKLDYLGMIKYIEDIFKDNNKKISSSCIKKILLNSQNNIDYAISEIDKILLYKIDDEVISEKDIDSIMSKNIEKEIYSFTDSLLSRNLKDILNSYNVLKSLGNESAFLLEVIANQIRSIYQVKVLSENMSASDIAKKLHMYDFQVKKILQNKSNYSEEELINYLYKLSEIDIDYKTKSLDEYLLIENFFLSL